MAEYDHSIWRREVLENTILGLFVRQAKHGTDSRADGAHAVDHATGLPSTAEGVRPRYAVLGGDVLALTASANVDLFARSVLGLTWKKTEEWTAEEVREHRDMKQAIRERVAALAFVGILDDAPPNGMPGELAGRLKGGAHEKGCQEFQITPSGLRQAKRRLEGTEYEQRGPMSILEDPTIPADVLRNAPEYFKAEARR